MKPPFSIAITAIVMLFVCCTKEPSETSENSSDAVSQKYGISVTDGRLHFATIADLKNVTTLSAEENEKMLSYVTNLKGFKSRAKFTQTLNKLGCDCTCPLKDDMATAMVDENFMIDVGYWTVRLNGCNQKYYAFYKHGLSEMEITKGLEAMRAGDFHTYQFYEIPHEYSLVEELSIYEEIFAGNPNAAERRCKDVPASDRLALIWRHQVPIMIPNGSFQIQVPEFHLFYKRGWLDHGFIHVFSPDIGEDNRFQHHWFIEVHPSNFREKCGDPVSRGPSAGHMFLGPGGWGEHDGDWFQRMFYNGARVKAGEGNFTVRIFHQPDPGVPEHNYSYTTQFMEILF